MCGNSEEKTKEAGGSGMLHRVGGQARPEDEQGALWLERKHRRMRQQGAGEGAHPRVSAGQGTAGLRGMAARAGQWGQRAREKTEGWVHPVLNREKDYTA